MYKNSRNALLISPLLLLVAACSGNTGGETQATTTTSNAYKSFSYRDAEASQNLQIRWLNDTAISFVLEHRQGACNYTLSGDAVNPYLAYDPESDTDEATGELYWVDIYLYSRGSCRLALRVAQDTSKARLQLANCNASADCAITSLGTLMRE